MNLNNLNTIPPVALYILFVWALIWKGLALWRAAKENRLNWFIAILVLNTVGILEIVFLFFFAKDKLTFPKLLSYLKFWQKKNK